MASSSEMACSAAYWRTSSLIFSEIQLHQRFGEQGSRAAHGAEVGGFGSVLGDGLIGIPTWI
jgi:hypothetical protein